MSKNPAWAIYNREVEKIEAEYDAVIDPLRKGMRNYLIQVDTAFNEAVAPLKVKHDKAVRATTEKFQETVKAEQNKRDTAKKAAHDVLKAELATKEEEKAAA